MSSSLRTKHCLPCEGKVAPLGESEVGSLLLQVVGWRLEGKAIQKEIGFKDFVAAMEFVNRVASLSEEESHHPDIHIHYNKVKFVIWTHAAGGLTENDFILAAKIDSLI